MPKTTSGLTIGLFGGSFNPAHNGHRLVADCGLRQARLHQIWWLVSPGNPLKKSTNNYAARVASVKALDLPRQMVISDIEQRIGTRYTVDMIRKLKRRYPSHRFVWLMGADNLLQLPKWKDWQAIMDLIPIIVIGRPSGGTLSKALKARLGQAAIQYRNARIPETQAHILARSCTPRWTYLTPPLNSLSSTKLRALKGHGAI